MNNLRDVWNKRFVFYINELQKYLKYIFSGHIAIVLVFVIGAAGYAYSEWLKTAPTNFPAFLLVAFILSLVFMISPPVTLMKQADSVYFLPLETKLNDYLKLALRWTYFSSVFIAIASFIVSIPLLTKVGGVSKNEVFVLFILVLIIKSWSMLVEFNYRCASNGKYVWVDRFVRFLLMFSALYFILNANFIVALGIVIICVIYLVAWQKKKKEMSFPFDHFIEVEQSRMMRFYRFANYFTDVPHIRGKIKRRKWLNSFYKIVPNGQKNAQLYLVMRTLIRTDDYFYLWVRLTFLSVLGTVFIPFPIVAIVFSSALAFATVIQLKHALLSGHEFRMDLLFPINPDARKAAVNKLLRMIQLVQAIFVLLGVLIQGNYSLLMLLVPIAVYVISELTVRMSKK
ncbi:ABC transporter permease [Psychrobacillus vulpis]|uniref:ABC transporter permease n=1 Tax=Psychrobacillus vulpis TaxID=2325572 RepID=A0A544TNM0_9BACI|nr:ABC transporter permease [Psychrobacillus vulpis]TQR19043.1 ABC transporter permease [Psychrobacillus vulpis]